MTDQHTDAVTVSRDGRVMTITLNRPDRHNAVNRAMTTQLKHALAEAAEDSEIRAVLLRGEGRSFSSGGDVSDFTPSDSPPSPAQRAFSVAASRDLIDAMLAVPQPIVAAVRGYALGLGATIALFCDVVVAADDAVFADTHVQVGLVAGDGGAVVWPLLAGLGRSRYHLLTGERITGALAAEWGLVHKAVPAAEADSAAREIADRLAALAPMAVRGTKATLNRIVRDEVARLLDYGLLSEAVTFVSEDHAEAVDAFMGKRPASFEDR